MIELRYDSYRRLVARLASGEDVVDVVPVRCFPFTARDEWIVLCDERGKELTCWTSLASLPPSLRAMLAHELDRRELVPIVGRVLDISPAPEPTTWHVLTDRGETRFSMPNEDHVRRLRPRGMLVIDAHGIRYRILDVHRLDARSRKLLSRYL